MASWYARHAPMMVVCCIMPASAATHAGRTPEMVMDVGLTLAKPTSSHGSSPKPAISRHDDGAVPSRSAWQVPAGETYQPALAPARRLVTVTSVSAAPRNGDAAIRWVRRVVGALTSLWYV